MANTDFRHLNALRGAYGNLDAISTQAGATIEYPLDKDIREFLVYNVGCSRIKGYGKIPKSRLLKKLESGDRDIYKEYVSFRCYKGKVVPSIERRRKVEYMLLFEK